MPFIKFPFGNALSNLPLIRMPFQKCTYEDVFFYQIDLFQMPFLNLPFIKLPFIKNAMFSLKTLHSENFSISVISDCEIQIVRSLKDRSCQGNFDGSVSF